MLSTVRTKYQRIKARVRVQKQTPHMNPGFAQNNTELAGNWLNLEQIKPITSLGRSYRQGLIRVINLSTKKRVLIGLAALRG